MVFIPSDVTISILNIGTAVMVRDVMDQHLRTLGDVRTYYASNLNHALQSYSERHLDLVFCELTFPGGSAEEFIRRIGGMDVTDNMYFAVCTSQEESVAQALATELNIDSVLMSPFSTKDIVARVEAMMQKRGRDRSGWIDQLLEAKLAAKNKRFQEAKTLFRELVKNHPANEEILLGAAKFFFSIPEYDNAAQVLSMAIALNPASLRAKTLFGLLAAKKGDFAEGLRILEECQKVSPLCTGRAMEIANCYTSMALRQARSALDMNNASAVAILSSIKYLTNLGRYTEAVTMYEKNRDHLIGDEKREAEYYTAISKKLGNIV